MKIWKHKWSCTLIIHSNCISCRCHLFWVLEITKERSGYEPCQSQEQLPHTKQAAAANCSQNSNDWGLLASPKCHQLPYAADKVIISFTRQQLQKACRTFVGRGLVKSQDVEAAPQQSCLFSWWFTSTKASTSQQIIHQKTSFMLSDSQHWLSGYSI